MRNRRTLLKRLATAVLGFSVVWSAGVFADLDKKIDLNLGLYTSSKPSAMVSQFRPIVRQLERQMSRRLGKPVRIRMQIAKTHQRSIEHLADGKVDFARFGSASYVEAKTENPRLQILAVESKNRTKISYGIIATGLHSTIRTLADLKGKSFAFGDEQSTSGRFMAQQFLLKNGIRAKDLSRYEYLGRHDIVGAKVGSGDFAAGAMSESTFRSLLVDGKKIRELARFPIASKPWIARSGIDPNIATALKLSLLEMNDLDALKSLGVNGFVNGSNQDYKVVADSMSQNHEFFIGDRRGKVEWVLATRKGEKSSSAAAEE